MVAAKTPLNAEELWTPSEVAALFGVGAKTVTRWANMGKLASVKTLGGHRRYRAEEVRALHDGLVTEADEPQE